MKLARGRGLQQIKEAKPACLSSRASTARSMKSVNLERTPSRRALTKPRTPHSFLSRSIESKGRFQLQQTAGRVITYVIFFIFFFHFKQIEGRAAGMQCMRNASIH
jgi:hypothetical protein